VQFLCPVALWPLSSSITEPHQTAFLEWGLKQAPASLKGNDGFRERGPSAIPLARPLR
jgi:hypothetical protein